MTKALTVDVLLKYLQVASDRGYGDMNIKCMDAFLYEDEIYWDFFDRNLVFQKIAYATPITEKLNRFRADIQKAYDRFWGIDDGGGDRP